jgi:hypothetical protein
MPARPTIDRERVRELLAQGMKVPQIAVRLGVNRVTLYQIAKGAKR